MIQLMRVMVVEDDKKIASFVANGLKQSCFAVDHCEDGEDAIAMLRGGSYDAAVLDIMLPKLDGLSVLQLMRSEGIAVPVIIRIRQGKRPFQHVSSVTPANHRSTLGRLYKLIAQSAKPENLAKLDKGLAQIVKLASSHCKILPAVIRARVENPSTKEMERQ